MKNINEIIYLVMALIVMTPVLCCGGCCGTGEDCQEGCQEELSLEVECTTAPECREKQKKSEKKHKPAAEHKKALPEAESASPAAQDTVPKSEEHHKHVRNMAETMLKAIKDKDYHVLAENMPEGCEIPVTAEEFEVSSDMLRDQFGDLAEYTFLTELDTPLVCNQLWKTAFDKKDSEGKNVRQELVFRFVTAERDGCPQIIGFGFM